MAQASVKTILPFPRFSIRKKLLAMSLWASSGALLLASITFMAYDLISYRAALLRTVATLGEIISLNSASAVVFNDAQAATLTLASLKARRTIKSAGIYTAHGQLFSRWQRDGRETGSPPPLPKSQGISHRFTRHFLLLFHPIVLDNVVIGMVYIESDLSDLTKRVQRYILIVSFIFSISILVAVIISLRVSEKISQPILDLTQMAKTISEQNDYSVRAPGSGEDEIGLLITTFNQMLDKIQQDQEEIRRLNDDLEQKVIRRTAQLTAANRELEAFSYSVSHDLRTPLRAIDGFSRELAESAQSRLNATEQNDLRRIRMATQRMAQLIDDLLQLAGVTRGEITRTTVNLSALVEKLVQDLRNAQPERLVDVQIAPQLTVRGDIRLISLALENLVGNAWKFTARRERARIEFGVLNDAKTFYIRDNGAGFNMDYAGKLFGAFQRLHDTRDYPGTGIGLATVQRIILRHGGRIWAQAEPDKGAVFYFTFSQEAT